VKSNGSPPISLPLSRRSGTSATFTAPTFANFSVASACSPFSWGLRPPAAPGFASGFAPLSSSGFFDGSQSQSGSAPKNTSQLPNLNALRILTSNSFPSTTARNVSPSLAPLLAP